MRWHCKWLRINGAPERIRTTNLLIRSQMLYPVELRALYLVKMFPAEDLFCLFYGRRNEATQNSAKTRNR